MNKNKKAFSFVEIIIVVSLIVLLSVIWVSVNSQFQEKSKNTKISSDIETLKNSLTQYKQEIKTLPFPWGNINFFTTNWLYSHDETNAFWVYGGIEEQTIEKKYMSFHPLDPRTNQYYAYGKTIKDNFFEIAGVLKEDGKYISKVLGDYSGEWWPYNLIREYNGPNFVEDKSTIHFPYNPDERVITAHISSYSWAITINDEPKTSSWEILTFIFKEWDKLKVSTWWYANIYYSDGSTSTLWDSMRDTELAFASMQYPQENNLVTKVKLALKTGTIWTKAAKLREDSEFEIYTTDSTAAVRGTIFWVQKIETWKTNITVTIGKVDVKKNRNAHYPDYWFESLFQDIKKEETLLEWIYVSWWWHSNITMVFNPNLTSYIEVLPWETKKWIIINSWMVSDDNSLPENFQTESGIAPLNATVNSFPCPYSFVLDGECVYNWLASKWWTLIWYAPFDTDTTLYYTDSDENIISTGWTLSGSLSFQDGGVLVGTWESLKYDINTLNLWDNFAIEAEVKGSDLKRTIGNTYYILYNSWSSIFLKVASTRILKWGIIPFISINQNNYINSIEDEIFYQVQFIKQWNDKMLRIIKDNKEIIKNTWTVTSTLTWAIFIWNFNGSSYPWLWTIKNFKIYKKN